MERVAVPRRRRSKSAEESMDGVHPLRVRRRGLTATGNRSPTRAHALACERSQARSHALASDRQPLSHTRALACARAHADARTGARRRCVCGASAARRAQDHVQPKRRSQHGCRLSARLLRLSRASVSLRRRAQVRAVGAGALVRLRVRPKRARCAEAPPCSRGVSSPRRARAALGTNSSCALQARVSPRLSVSFSLSRAAEASPPAVARRCAPSGRGR